MKKYNSSLRPYIIWLIEHKLDFILWPVWFILILPVYIIGNIPEAFKNWQDEWLGFLRERKNIIKQIKK